MALERGEGKRKVMFLLPPGSAKSTYASILFPPWFLMRNPGMSVLAASHNEDLAERFSRRVRNTILEHPETLGFGIDGAVGLWRVLPRTEDERAIDMAEYLAAGAGSAIAGFRADLGIIDDPLKGREEASQETQRQKLWEWYVFDYRPRLKPWARQIFICTRWHEDDLAGRILAEEGDEWDVISIPMEAEDIADPLGRRPGEMLWREWFTDEMIRTAKRDPVLWNSLYQQRPTVEQGDYWRRDWLHAVDPKHVPPRNTMRVYGGSDYAVSKDRGDYTVHAVLGLDPSDRPWLLDLWRAQTASDVWVSSWCDLVCIWKPLQWGEEGIQITSGVGPWLERLAKKRRAFTERIQFPTRGDKGVRAQSIRGHVATHGLWYSQDLPHRGDMEAELLAFPNGKHDDVHDALGLVGQLLDLALAGKKQDKSKAKKSSGYRTVGGGQAEQKPINSY